MKRQYEEVQQENLAKKVKVLDKLEAIKKEKNDLDKKILKVLQKCPKLMLEKIGKQSSLSVEASARVPLTTVDLQELILSTVFYKKDLLHFGDWFTYKRLKFLRSVSIVVVEGIDFGVVDSICKEQFGDFETDLEKMSKVFPLLSKHYIGILSLVSPQRYPEDMVQELMTVIIQRSYERKGVMAVLNGNDVKIKILPTKRNGQFHNTKKKDDQFSRTVLLLKEKAMKALRYPLPGSHNHNYCPLKSNYVPVTDHSPLYGLDCETSGGKITAIAVIDENEKVVYYNVLKWNLCKFMPYANIGTIDYDTELKEVQKDLDEILPPDAILVGHSMQHDLSHLKASHPYCIDTARIFAIDQTTIPKLKVLAKIFLWQDVQATYKSHDPVEDARTSLALVKKKLSKDKSYGNVFRGGNLDCTKADVKKISNQVARNEGKSFKVFLDNFTSKDQQKMSKNILQLSSDNFGETNICTTPDLQARRIYDIDTEKCQFHIEPNVKQVLKCAKQMIDSKFTLSHIKYPFISYKKIKKLDKRLESLHEVAPPCSLQLTVFTGLHGPDQTNGMVFIKTNTTEELKTLKQQVKMLFNQERLIKETDVSV